MIAQQEDFTAQLGLSPEDAGVIRVGQADWVRLMQSGIIISLKIRRWRGNRKMELVDLGIQIGDEREAQVLREYVALGHKRLMPERVLNMAASTEVLARQNLEANSFPTFWGRFVPVGAFKRWREADRRLEAAYRAAAQEMIDNWDANAAEVRAAYLVAGRGAYDRLAAIDPQGTGCQDREEFAEGFTDRIMASLPAKENVAASIDYQREMSFIPLPALVEKDLRQRERSFSQSKEQQEMVQAVTAEASAQKDALIGGFLRDVQADLRSRMYDVVLDVLGAIQRNEGSLGARSVVQLRNLVDSVSALNFWGDADLEARMAEIRNMLAQKATERDVTEVQTKLQELGTASRAILLDLGENPRSGRELGIADWPAMDAARLGRALDEGEVIEIGSGRKARSVA